MGSRLYSNKDVLEEVKRVNNLVDGPIKQNDFDKHAEMTAQTAYSRFGSWNAVKEAAGLASEKLTADVTCRERQKRIKQIKNHARCESCGDKREPVAMDFHHKQPDEKIAPISRLCSYPLEYSWEDVLNEIKKCSLLCAACHMEIEHGNRQCP